jgi:outer membrane protein OmpA-like peptidoglycan-associated protein
MKIETTARTVFPMLVLASAMTIPALAQQSQPSDSSSAPAAAAQQAPTPDASQAAPAAAAQTAQAPTSTPPPAASTAPAEPKEGFWGRMNPMARKVWVKKRIDPINDRLNELDQVNAKNAQDIKDVDSRAQAGIKKAQDSADAANQAALAAGDQAKKANDTATTASGRVDQLSTTVNGLDNYKSISDVEVPFKGGSPVLSKDAKAQLDDMAKSLEGHSGYIIELEAHSPSAGATGIANSQREAEAVKRYLVANHEIPVYRMHSVALGNAQPPAPADQAASAPKEKIKSTVHIKLMENSLAAQGSTSPHGMASLSGAERP